MDELFPLGDVPNRNGTLALTSAVTAQKCGDADPTAWTRLRGRTGCERYALSSHRGRVN